MKNKTFLMFSMTLMLLTGYAGSEIVVDLKASDLAPGTTREWVNNGTAGGKFVLISTDTAAVVETLDGKPCVTLTGTNQSFKSDFKAPGGMTGVTGTNPWTVVALVRSPRHFNQTYFTWARRGVNNGGVQCMFWNDAALGAMNHFGTGNGIGWGAAAPSLNQWHYLTVTYSGLAGGNIENAYMDGQLVNTKTIPLNLQTDSYLFVGSRVETDNNTRGSFFQGSLSSLQLYNEEMTPAQVAQLSGRFLGPSVTPASGTVEEGGATVNFTVSLGESPSGGPTQPVSVVLTPNDTGEDILLSGAAGAGQPATVTFTSADWNTPRTITISAVDDTNFEADESIGIAISANTTDPVYSAQTLWPLSIGITVKDNERKDNPIPPVYQDGFLFDDYAIARDYLIYGVTNTPYDGLLNTQSYTLAADSSLTTPGSLRLCSNNAAWDNNNNSGPFLYQNVSGDFIIETNVTGYAGGSDQANWVLHNDCGILIRNPDTTNGENNLQNSYFPIWNCGNMIRYNIDGVRTDNVDTTGKGFAADKYLRVERRGPLFHCSHSADGITWTEFPSSPFSLANLNVETLQVGIQHATYNNNNPPNLGWVEFGYLKLKSPIGTVEGTLDLYETLESTGNLQVALTPPAGFPAPLDDIQVTLRSVALAGAGADANDIQLGSSTNGQPITLTFTKANWSQPQSVQVQAVKDNDSEETQILTVGYTVASNDPNWNGAMIRNAATIRVYEPTPGIVLSQSGGNTVVVEGGATDTFDISLQSKPTANVTVDLTDNGTPPQATFVPAQLIFSEADWSQAQTVTVSAVDDAVLEGDPHTGSFKVVASNSAEYNPTDTTIAETSFQIHDNECGAWGYGWADSSHDCVVNLQDLALFCLEWIKCTRPYDPECINLP